MNKGDPISTPSTVEQPAAFARRMKREERAAAQLEVARSYCRAVLAGLPPEAPTAKATDGR